ncbi:hypothetical protein MFLAVUS_010334 [Mucor flavus]|uniref:Uncharacterized protein n=1 Tax=Mucor flavus TaxID=439312 RepID=A0ABP9ZCJ3_9FUNG
MTTSNLDIPFEFYLQRLTPDYNDEIVNICFESELHFQAWFNTVAVHQAGWTVKITHDGIGKRVFFEIQYATK